MAFLLVGVFAAGLASTTIASTVYTYFASSPQPIQVEPSTDPVVIITTKSSERTLVYSDPIDLFNEELRLALTKRRNCISPGV